MSANVFSPAYTLKLDGYEIDSSLIKSMQLVRTAEAMPVKGIVSSALYVTLKTSLSLTPNAPVVLTLSGGPAGTPSGTFSTHRVSRISRKGSMLSIVACDLMRKTDNYFDDSLYNRDSEPFNASLLLADLAVQCGFKGVENVPSCFSEFYYDDIHGRKVREILDLVSEYAVGTWWCTNSEYLKFTPFLSSSCDVAVDEENSAPYYLHSIKGPFTSVYCKNTASDQVFSAGSTSSDFTGTLALYGRLFDSARAKDIMSAVANESYQAFYCDHMTVGSLTEGITRFCFISDNRYLISCVTRTRFAASGVFCSAKAADICEDESDYESLTRLELRKKIDEGKLYGSTVMTGKGIGFVDSQSADDPRKRIAYFFSSVNDGVASFDGAMLDKVMPDKIESVSDTEKRITYGNITYVLKFTVNEDGSKSGISFEIENETGSDDI